MLVSFKYVIDVAACCVSVSVVSEVVVETWGQFGSFVSELEVDEHRSVLVITMGSLVMS